MKNLITIGIGALAVVGGLFLYNHTRKRIQIPREQIVTLLKKLRQQMYVPLLQISVWASENASQATPDQLRSLLKSQQNPFKEMIKQKQDKVFTDVTNEQFQDSIQFDYNNDVEIQYLVRQYQQQFQKAIMGVSPQLRDTNIVFMTQQKILSTVEDILSHQLQTLSQKITKKMPISQMSQIIKQQQRQMKVYRQKKLKQLGLTSNQKTMINNFQFCISKYMRMDSQFRQKYLDLIKMHEKEKDRILEEFCEE